MLAKLHLPRFLFGGVLLVVASIATFGFVTFEKNIEVMRIANQENILWSSTQLEKELMRFRDSLRSREVGQATSLTDINLRFDVLWSRVAIFQRGAVGARLSEYDSETHTIDRLFDELKAQEARVVSINAGDHAALAIIHQAFYPYSEELSELSSRVASGEERKAALVRERIRAGAAFALYASFGTVILVVMALLYFVWEGRRYRKVAQRNMVLAEQFKQASLVKSRFLTMMSHELRTPMNGVLGLLAVAREAPKDSEQKEWLDQADRSANRMLGMLTDILDFAALENAQYALDHKPFLSEELIAALPDLLGPSAAQANARFSVLADGDLPVLLKGDATRLRRSYALMIAYFLETAGARDIELRLSYSDGHLIGRIVVDYLGEGWSPELIFGKRDESNDNFATDVLGPSVARTLVEKMKGEIRQEDGDGNTIMLVIDVPVESLGERRLKVLLNMQSTPMEMICRSAVSGIPIDYMCASDANDTEVVMLETGATYEQEMVEMMRKSCPSALIIGIGRPKLAALFDFTAEVPLEAALLKRRLFDLFG